MIRISIRASTSLFEYNTSLVRHTNKVWHCIYTLKFRNNNRNREENNNSENKTKTTNGSLLVRVIGTNFPLLLAARPHWRSWAHPRCSEAWSLLGSYVPFHPPNPCPSSSRNPSHFPTDPASVWYKNHPRLLRAWASLTFCCRPCPPCHVRDKIFKITYFHKFQQAQCITYKILFSW